MRYLISFLIAVNIFSCGYSQTDDIDPSKPFDQKLYEKHYRIEIKDFYKLLFKDSVSSSECPKNLGLKVYREIKKKYFLELTNGLPIGDINALIDKCEISYELSIFTVLLELKFPNSGSIYYELLGEYPGEIEDIYSKDGISIISKISSQIIIKLERPGIINDKDGYVNIRESQSINSKIVGKLINSEFYFYTPLADSDWWPVKKVNSVTVVGYIHKSRITKYNNFPKAIKEKFEKARGGC